MRLTNETAAHSTISSWNFYNRVRGQFADWNCVILTVPGEPEEPREVSTGTPKLVVFIDDRGDRLDLYGINYGYGEDDSSTTPGELLQVLLKEGFGPRSYVADLVLNPDGRSRYPVWIYRD